MREQSPPSKYICYKEKLPEVLGFNNPSCIFPTSAQRDRQWLSRAKGKWNPHRISDLSHQGSWTSERRRVWNDRAQRLALPELELEASNRHTPFKERKPQLPRTSNRALWSNLEILQEVGQGDSLTQYASWREDEKDGVCCTQHTQQRYNHEQPAELHGPNRKHPAQWRLDSQSPRYDR